MKVNEMRLAHNNTSLLEVKNFLRENYKNPKGCICPACKQNVKLYERKLGAAQSRALIRLGEMNQSKEWCDVKEVVKGLNVHGDFAKMRYWGLIEQKPNDDTSKKNSGYWKITEKGKQFIRNEIRVPSHALIYKGELRGFTEQTTDIVEALGKHFNYQELMSR